MREAIDLKYPEGNQTYRYQDYKEWEGQWELINGVPSSMSPVPTPLHQTIVGNIFGEIRAFLGKDGCQVFIAPFDIRLSQEDDYNNPNTVIKPDVLVICQKERIDDKGLRGAPGLAVEVLSPSTALKDRNEKFSLYLEFGTSEYWIVDAVHKTIEIYTFKNRAVSSRTVFGVDDELCSEYLKGFKFAVADLLE